MEIWEARLVAHIEMMREDDKQVDIIFNNFLDQICHDVIVYPKVLVKNSRPRQRGNLEREGQEKHDRMFTNYF